MKKYPEFLTTEANRVAHGGDPALQGFVFEGADEAQVVFWQSEKSGEMPEDAHDFWEYALVVEGTFDGMVGGKRLHLEPGDEMLVPPHTPHSGRYSAGYRSIDVFGGKRVERLGLARKND